jgi:hypothetical protein
MIDSDKEKSIGIGRRWPFQRMNRGEVVLSYKAALFLGVSIGSVVMTEVSLVSFHAVLFRSLWCCLIKQLYFSAFQSEV